MTPPEPNALVDALQELVLSIGPDGRVFFHDLDRQLLEVALAMNPADDAMRRRLETCRDEQNEGTP